MHGQVEASIQYEHLPVRAVQLSDRRAADDVPWVAGHGDDVVENDLVGQQVEEVCPVGESNERLFDDAKERLQRPEVV
jgi:hypothetical protein